MSKTDDVVSAIPLLQCSLIITFENVNCTPSNELLVYTMLRANGAMICGTTTQLTSMTHTLTCAR
jgi:hypothetical protein